MTDLDLSESDDYNDGLQAGEAKAIARVLAILEGAIDSATRELDVNASYALRKVRQQIESGE